MPHLIILEKNRDLMKLGADASCQLTEIHEAYEALPEGITKTTVGTMLDNLSENL